MLLKQLGQGNVVTLFLPNELKSNATLTQETVGLTVLICGMSQKLYKITVSKGNICKHAKLMLNVSSMLLIASGVSK